MTRERAEQIIYSLKGFGVIAPIAIAVDDGTMLWYCPPGNAEGSERDPCRTLPFGITVTMWPRNHIYGLYEGQEQGPMHTPRLSRHHLWPQELYVYLQERSTAITRAMEEMDKVFPKPRLPGHDVHDIEPYPEDFGMDYVGNTAMIEAVENWLHNVPSGTTL
jgi:hypothetical protein